jgi:methionine transaminase
MHFKSKLPNIGTSIFTKISAEAEKFGAINLAQGFPDYDCDPMLKECVSSHLYNGKNQYAPMAGVLKLKEQIADKFYKNYSTSINPIEQICVTAGATQAIFTAIAAFVSAGDEVLLIEPIYDCYIPAILSVGGVPKVVTTFAPSFDIDWENLANKINPKVKMIIINNPGNPSTKILKEKDIIQLSKIIEDKNIIILSDEVYEHLVYNTNKHISASSIDSLKEKCISVFSFGKTFHVTGWKIGYCISSEKLMKEFLKVHQFNVFCVNSFLQYGLADYIEKTDSWKNLPSFFDKKKQILEEGLINSGFKNIPGEGSFFSLFDYSSISEMKDTDFVYWLIHEYKIAAIPLSSFYVFPRLEDKIIRLCFAKKSETLVKALEKLLAVSPKS